MRRVLVCLPLCLAAAPYPPPADFRPTALADVAPSDAPLPTPAALERLARTDPVAFLEALVRRYDREVTSYTCRLYKCERIRGHLQAAEEIDVSFREEPLGVLFRWRSGARLASAALYARNANDDKLLVMPAGVLSLAGIQTREPEGDDARRSGRYPLTEFGLQTGTRRTLAAWIAARKENTLHVEYLGTDRPDELGGRPCWVLRRTRYARPESDGITEQLLYVDQETWLQVGNVLTGEKGALIGEYYFRDVTLNPTFAAGAFTRAALRK